MSAKLTPRTSGSNSRVSNPTSIPDIIHSLKYPFEETQFKEAMRALIARENNLKLEKDKIIGTLREKCDEFETEVGELKTQKYVLEEERRILRREIKVNDDKLNDYARELGLMRDKEEKAVKRYDGLLEQVKEWEVGQKGLIDENAKLRGLVNELRRELRNKEEIVAKNMEEMGVLRRENGVLKEAKAKFGVILEDVKRGKEERVRELLEEVEVDKRRYEEAKVEFDGRIKELENEKGWLEEAKAEFDARMEVVMREKGRLEEAKVEFDTLLEGVKRKNDCLEKEKGELKALCEELMRNDAKRKEEIKGLLEKNEVSEREKLEILRKKDEIIMELEKEKEGLAMKLMEAAANKKLIEEQLLQLEGDFIAKLCLDLKRDDRFPSSKVGKVLARLLTDIESEEMGLTCNAQEADSTSVSRVNEPAGLLKSYNQSEDAVRRTLVFDEEVVKENGATGKNGTTENGKNRTTENGIIIIDSDDDNENPLYVSGHKRKHEQPDLLSEQCNFDSSGDDNLHPKQKKKLEHVQYEPVKYESSTLSAAEDGHRFSISKSQTLPTIRKCEENLREQKVGEILDDGGRTLKNIGYNNELNKADKPCTPRLEAYMATLRKRKEYKKLECVADMLCAFDENLELCASAVCALYRQHISQASIGISGKGFEECDVDRVATLAKFLTDGYPKGDMRKSLDKLQKHDPRGHDDCRRLAKKYSKQLIDIYKKGKDSLFSPFSTDLQNQ